MNVLSISITFIPSVLLCGHCQLDYLAKNERINYKFIPEHFLNKEIVEWADIIVFIRSDSDLEAHVAKIARKAGKRCVYVLDDDLLNVPSYASSYPYYSLPSTHKNMKTVMENCDMFLTPSPVLMEKYGGPFKYKYLIAEPSLNRIQVKPKNEKVKIGFAGSTDRANDLNDILRDTIKRLIDKYGDKIEFEFMGAKASFIEELGLKFLPYQDGYDAYTAFMSKCNWDIGLAPMPDSEFHRCKYFNKFVEYASFGIVGVYSNLEPYIYGIKDRVNGLLVENTNDAWFNALCELIDNKELREQLSKECLRQANEIYSLETLAVDYLEKITKDYVPLKNVRIPDFTIPKATFFVKRVYRKIKEQGKDFPDWLKKKLETKKEERERDLTFRKNTEKLKDIINNKKTIFVIAPKMDLDNPFDEYEERVKEIDNLLKDDRYVILLNGEDRLLEQINTEFIDDNHAYLSFNSYAIKQFEEMLPLFKKGGLMLIHGVNRFMSEKLCGDMFKIFDEESITTIWDTHGLIPEKYHEAANFHMENVTNSIEKVFYDKSDLILVKDENNKEHLIKKYEVDRNNIVVVPSKDITKLKNIIK